VWRLANKIKWLVAGGRGFEPRLTGPEPVVLPLDDPPIHSPILMTDQMHVKTIYSQPSRW
jgi:hypothetical protein